MADKSLIEWTDTTWQIVTGCSVVSPGCTNCYAMRLAGGRMQHHPSRAGLTVETKAGPVWNGQVRFNENWLTQPLHWKTPRKIFVAAHGDLFHEGVTDAQLDLIFAVMALCPQHTFQVLTKRPERMRDYLTNDLRDVMILEQFNRLGAEHSRDGFGYRLPLPNVWLGVSVEDQVRADERIPALLATPAEVRWISAEPLLGPIDLSEIEVLGGDAVIHPLAWDRDCIDADGGDHPDIPPLDWVVVGGESGKGARPMHPDWARQIRDQCAAAGVPFLFKQWGAWCPGENVATPSTSAEDAAWWDDDGWDIRTVNLRESQEMHYEDEPNLWRVGKGRSGRLLDAVLHDGYPS